MKTSDVPRKTDENRHEIDRQKRKNAQSQFQGLFKTRNCCYTNKGRYPKVPRMKRGGMIEGVILNGSCYLYRDV